MEGGGTCWLARAPEQDGVAALARGGDGVRELLRRTLSLDLLFLEALLHHERDDRRDQMGE